MKKNKPNNVYRYSHSSTSKYRNDEPVYFLIGTPTHSNIGDRAIAYAEIEFIANNNNKAAIIEVPYGEDISNLDVRSGDTIILHGGGNLGDIWPEEEEYRQKIISTYRDEKIILMPQTIFFKNTDLLNKSRSLYASCKDLTLIAREKTSFHIMKENYTKNKVVLIPDIVLSIKVKNPVFSQKKEYALFVIRDDKEKTTPASFIHRAEDVVKYELGIDNFIFSDMHCKDSEAMINSHQFITEYKLNQYRRAKVVVTDRLHGMIFAVITRTPCLVFGSMTQKTKGVYDLIKQTKAGAYVRMCDDEADISSLLQDITSKNKHSKSTNEFDHKWRELADIIDLKQVNN